MNDADLFESSRSSSLSADVAAAVAHFWSFHPLKRQPVTDLLNEAELLNAGVRLTSLTAGEQIKLAIQAGSREDGKRVVERCLERVRTAGFFSGARESPPVRSLRAALAQEGAALLPEGFVDWNPPQTQPTITASTSRRTSRAEQSLTADLLAEYLHRSGSAARVLVHRTRAGRSGLAIDDEYDVQDIVGFLLRSVAEDVRSEDSAPSRAGANSRIDFVLARERLAVEVKVTKLGRGAGPIGDEIAIDIVRYERHPSVDALVFVVYDLANTIDNPTALIDDIETGNWAIPVRVVITTVPPRGAITRK